MASTTCVLTAGEPPVAEGRPHVVGTACTGIAGGFDIVGGADVKGVDVTKRI